MYYWCPVGISLIGYLFVYSNCVIEHPLYKDKLLFPFWASGKLEEMIRVAGSRYGAVDKYGLAAVFDAISQMPGTAYALALGTLLLLYALPLATTCAMAFVLALRYPSSSSGRQLLQTKLLTFSSVIIAPTNLPFAPSPKGSRRIEFGSFFDEKENPPGQVWTKHVERALDAATLFAIFIGAAGIGKWQQIEIQNITEARMERGCSVMPAFLPDAQHSARLPMQLAGLTWIDFRRSDPDPMAELIQGISTRSTSRQDEGPRTAETRIN